MNKVVIYADGGCRGNGKENNVGGWGVVLRQGPHSKTLKGYDYNTTNNKMELTAAICALQAIKHARNPIELYMDSAYVVNNLKFVPNWAAKGWKRGKNEPVKNKELWQQLYELKTKLGFVTLIKVKGHAGVEDNELADQLANEAMDEAQLLLGGN